MKREQLTRSLILVGGLVASQFLLYGSSLIGSKVLLPLDILALPGVYLPGAAGAAEPSPQDHILVDLVDQVFLLEFDRRFAREEWRAGRVPLWRPGIYCGTPFVAHPKFSPFYLICYLFPGPLAFAWVHVLKAVVTGLGAYLVFRRVVRVGFWPAAVGAWVYPLTGFFTYNLGMPVTLSAAWLPWLLLATDRALRRPRGWGGPALAVVTTLAAVSGQLDIAGLDLLASGFFALWCLWDEYGRKGAWVPAARAAAVAALGWGLGLALAAPYILPLVEYSRTGARMARRAAGAEERPPVGLAALPQALLPEFYGATRAGTLLLTGGNLLESAGGAYAGLLAALVLAPLGWCSRPHRPLNAFWALLAFLTFSWQLNVVGLVQVWRLPGLNMLSYNRFVFVTAFAVLATAVVGLEVLRQGVPAWSRWFWAPVGALAVLGCWCLSLSADPPAKVADIERLLRAGDPASPGLREIPYYFRRMYLEGALLCGLALASWLLIRRRTWPGPRLAVGLSVLGLLEVLWFAWGANPQCEPALYYPPIPVLEELSRLPPGRVLACGCLPANLAERFRLRDLRGYDAVDPRRYVEVLGLARAPQQKSPDYALVQTFLPRFFEQPPGTLRVPAVLNMLNLRYLIFRNSPPPVVQPLLVGPDYWVLENPDGLPRAYVPRHVETVPEGAATLTALAAPDFDPRQVAYVNQPVELPTDCRGRAEVVDETPTRVALTAELDAPGLVVLADRWDAGWKVEVNGTPAPVLVVNHTLRGVPVPAGTSTLVFRYEPASFALGLRLLLAGLVILAGWSALTTFLGRRT